MLGGHVSSKVVAELQEYLLEKDVADEVRLEVLARVDRAVTGMASAHAKERWRLGFQRTFLQVVLLFLVVWLGFVWVRVIRVEKIALARAYSILVQRMGIASHVGMAAMDMALNQVGEWAKGVQNDPNATGSEKEIRLENLKRIGEALKGFRATYEASYKDAQATKVPDSVDALTVVRDPFTKMDLPLNATMDGVVDQKALKSFLDSQEWLAALLLTAKQGSAPGVTQLLPKFDSKSDQFVLDLGAMNAVGVAPPASVQKDLSAVPPPTNLPPLPEPNTSVPDVQKK